MFFYVYLFTLREREREREREHACVCMSREGQRGWEGENPRQALCSQCRVSPRAQSVNREIMTRVEIQSQSLHQQSHPHASLGAIVKDTTSKTG